MASKVEIVNIALARLGESPIQSLTEDSGPARTVSLLFDSARRSALRDYDWSFAIRTASLARLAVTPDEFDFRFAYALPPDCLRALRLRSGGSYLIRYTYVYTDDPAPTLEYVADVTDTEKFDAKFTEAFTYKLASELAMSVKGSPDLMAAMSNAYTTLTQSAAAETIRESHAALPENPYVEARTC